MKQIITAVLLLFAIQSQAQYDSYNMQLLSHWDNDALDSNKIGQSFNDVFGWYDSVKKREYAIVGSIDSTYFFDVTDPYKPVKCAVKAARAKGVTWHDYDTYKHYCYAVLDGGYGSLQIFDMSYLPDSVHTVYDNDSLITASHTITISGDKLYSNISWTKNGTLRPVAILSLADPENPVIAGIITPPIFNGSAAFNACHDTYIRNDTLYCSGENSGLFIFDVTKPANAKYLATIKDYPEKGYNHSSAVTDDGKYIFFTDENVGMGIKAFDISNFNNIDLKSVFRSNPGALAHNPYLLGKYLYVSYYHDGVYVFDISNPEKPTVRARFDTYPQNPAGNYDGFKGCWAVYAKLPSGNLLAVDMVNGLFVLKMGNPESVDELGVVNFNLYPNPLAEDKFTINLLNQNEKEVTVKITDAIGVEIGNTATRLETGFNSFEVDLLAGTKPGIYFVTITGRNSNICRKILKP